MNTYLCFLCERPLLLVLRLCRFRLLSASLRPLPTSARLPLCRISYSTQVHKITHGSEVHTADFLLDGLLILPAELLETRDQFRGVYLIDE